MITQAPLLRQPRRDPTDLQRAASDPSSSVWVNASAGSGKTTILTNRVTRLLLAGVRPDKILCLTFTRAAAAEMALRVSERLSHWAVCSDNDLNASLGDLQGRAPSPQEMTRARRLFAETLACSGGMRIRTLHAFGQEILRRFPIESGLPPHFAVIEEEDARGLQQEVLTGLLRRASANPKAPLSEAIAHLIETLGEKGFYEATANLLRDKARLQQAVTHHGDLPTLIAQMRGALSLAPGDNEESLLREAFSEEFFPEDTIRDAAKLLLQGLKTSSKRGTTILAWLDNSQRMGDVKTYIGCFLKKDGELFENYGDKALLKSHPTLDAILRREATRLQSLAERCATVKIAATTEAALRFGIAFITAYKARKNLQAALDYDDLVQETLNLLKRPGIAPWVLHKLDDGLDHLLVDEAQDTSRAQWDIVATLADEFFSGVTAQSKNRTLFVVGDEKQSIYSFQNADPEAFAAMRDYFSHKIRAAEKTMQEIPLHVSFRSAPAILRAVDAVFADPAAMAGVSAVPVEHSSFKRDTLFGRVELWPLIAPVKEEKQDSRVWDLPLGYESEQDQQAELATHVAATIKGWLSTGACLAGSNHVIRPGDIMILLKKRGRFADLMVRALKQKPQDVPVTGVDRMRLMEQLPVMDLLALLQFSLLPEDDLNLAALLRSPLLNLSEDDLMRVAASRKGISLWQNLRNNAASPTYQPAHDYLAAWLGQADFMTPFAMLTRILNQPCPASSVSGRRALWMRLGLDALDPIDELLNAAQNFSRRHAPSLQSFLHWLSVGDSEIKRELDSGKTQGDGQVRIMTVHASKGLEAPIVFLPDTANVPRVQDVAKLLWDDTQHLPFYLATKPTTGPMRTLWGQAREKQLQEYRRLLYVALTRASHQLYIAGWEPSRKEPDSDTAWHALVKNGLQQSEPHATHAEGIIVWEDPALTPAKPITTARETIKVPSLPAWALQKADAESNLTASLSPSTLVAMPSAATPDEAFARGRIIHRLLQNLPDIEPARREDAARRFLAHPQHQLSITQQDDIRAETAKLLQRPDFAELFGPDSRAEVPLAGFVDGRQISGQVDRLVVRADEVWVLDYKTNRPPPVDVANIPAAYRAQMAAYRSVLQAIYPQKQVRCFLLWTYAPFLMEVAPENT